MCFSMEFKTLASLFVCLFALTSVRGEMNRTPESDRALVVGVAQARVGDLVALDAGSGVGLRAGMVCEVTRDGSIIGDLLLVELRPRTATALVLRLVKDHTIRIGDGIDHRVFNT